MLRTYRRAATVLPAIALLALTLAACGSPGATSVPPTTSATGAPVAATGVPVTPTGAATATEQPTDTPVADDTTYLDPCTVLTTDIIEALYGTIEDGPTTVYNNSSGAAPSRTCQYETKQAALLVKTSSGGETTQRAMSTQLAQDGITLVPDDETNVSFFGSTAKRAVMLMLMGDAVIVLDLTDKTGDLETQAALHSLRSLLMMQVADEAPADEVTPEPNTNIHATAEAQASVDKAAMCELLTVAEVEQVLGKLAGTPDSETATQNGIPVCSYTTASVMLGVGTVPGDADTLQTMVEDLKQQGAPVEPLPELGDAAYLAVAEMPGMSNKQTVIGIVMVLQGNTILTINMLGGADELTTYTDLLKLAQFALPRLP